MKFLSSFLFFLLFTDLVIGQTVIRMRREGGVSMIPCTINGLPLNFILDTGASSVSISLTEASFMLKNGQLKQSDILGKVSVVDATGKISEAYQINLKEIVLGGLKLYNVRATIVSTANAPLLLGQSALSQLGRFELNLEKNTLTLFNDARGYDYGNNQRVIKKNYKPVEIKDNLNRGVCFEQARLLYIEEKFKQAIEIIDNCIITQKEKTSPFLYGLKALALENLGNYVYAKQVYEEYFRKQNPKYISPGDNASFGRILLKFAIDLEEEEIAINYIKKAIFTDSIIPNKVGYIKLIGEYYRGKSEYSKSARWFNDVLQIRKNYSNLDLYNAGYDYFRAGMFDSSVLVFNKYTAKYPDDIFGYYMIAKANSGIDTTRTVGTAAAAYLKAIEVGEKSADKVKIKDQLAGAYIFMSQYSFDIKKDKASAIAFNDKALAVDPANPTALALKDYLIKYDPNKPTVVKTAPPAKPATPVKPKKAPLKKK
ncbi:MAG: retroviral-like aspartic protease family protein [Ferruginibacter sp.]